MTAYVIAFVLVLAVLWWGDVADALAARKASLLQPEPVEPWWLEFEPETLRVVIEEIGEDNLPNGLIIHAKATPPPGAYTSDMRFVSRLYLSRIRPEKGEHNGVQWEQQGTRFRVVYDQETNQGETFNSLGEALARIDSL